MSKFIREFILFFEKLSASGRHGRVSGPEERFFRISFARATAFC
ncbi:MAG: hypothetical protein Q8Q08_12005 [Candidatus Omnitrophota bacterium]|nr:hypothetical protein [Candidatus Omnitrophota bacterium]MDZ4241830.1 hypothetical protein [Candidatus Omnitrophota bacterium]